MQADHVPFYFSRKYRLASDAKFDESKVKRDEEGKFAEQAKRQAKANLTGVPTKLPAFHGTAAEFRRFEAKHGIGRRVTSLGGFSFTTDPLSASGYAASAARRTGGKQRVISVELTMQNPLDITETIAKLRKQKKLTFGEAKRQTLENFDPEKNDGIIFRGDKFNSDEYIVFNPDQIKFR